MRKHSIGFVALVLLLGLLIGAVLGSLIHQVFGFAFLNLELFQSPLVLADDFYILKRLEIQLTPGSILGLLVAIWMLFIRGRIKKET
ncbi:MAG: hypothetical protein KDK30_08055 [Leptospiraceae bacterium]|nr:hypothetical protein [Leptospiraceae bacterium]MCB1317142.1 hypothetical protein [Leptospiraceae bacterium]